MISVNGLKFNNSHTRGMLERAPNETPACVQLFGSEPEAFKSAVESAELKGFEIIDINMGCPVKKVVKNGGGAALLKDVKTAARIVELCAGTGRNITVKIRAGMQAASKEETVAFARALYNSGAKAITVHGRAAAQFYGGYADWDIIGAVARELPVPVVGNGDVKSSDEAALRIRTYGVSGVMIGRGAIGNPNIFRFEAGNGGRPVPSLLETILKHIGYMREYFPERYAVVNMRKHLSYYLKGQPSARKLKNELNAIDSLDKLIEAIMAISQNNEGNLAELFP
jgi:nifR3 family TIM-barrel protein